MGSEDWATGNGESSDANDVSSTKSIDGETDSEASGSTDDETSGTSDSTDNSSEDTEQGAIPEAPAMFEMDIAQVKQFNFHWTAAVGAKHYQLFESEDGQAPFVQVGGDIAGQVTSHTVPLYARANASYVLRACNDFGCTDSEVLEVIDNLAEAIGYFKASNAEASDRFGISMALSGDGRTLAIGAYAEDSNAMGIGGDQANNSSSSAGAVYVYVRNDMNEWTQQAYLKASNTGGDDYFGWDLDLSGDGNTLAVGAYRERSNAVGINGNQGDNSAVWAGAVYVYKRDGMNTWTQQAYVKASNTDAGDYFGYTVAISNDGGTLAVGAVNEDSSALGIDGDQADNSATLAGAVYIFELSGMTQQAYIKASNTGAGDQFGVGLALSQDGSTLAVGARFEASNAVGINGNQADNSAADAGAVYVYERNQMNVWSQQDYIKGSNTGAGDQFGSSARALALSGDGNTLAVGAFGEDSSAVGIDGNQASNAASEAGAVYVFDRSEMDVWSQRAYIKASNAGMGDQFGYGLALSGDGSVMAVGAFGEDSNALGIDGNQADDSVSSAGAVYVYKLNGMGIWTQQAYVKASNADTLDWFGASLALSFDGKTMAVGASYESSNAVGISGDQANDFAPNAGAVYLY